MAVPNFPNLCITDVIAEPRSGIKAHGCFQVALGWYSGDKCSLYGHKEHYSPIMEAWNGR